jgi:hypothetical protein
MLFPESQLHICRLPLVLKAALSWGFGLILTNPVYSDRPLGMQGGDVHLAKYRHAKRTMWKLRGVRYYLGREVQHSCGY